MLPEVSRDKVSRDTAERCRAALGGLRLGTESGLVQLTSGASRDVGARWSLDGRTVAFASDRSGSDQIWLLALGSGETRQLTQRPSQHAWPAWSPDGTQVAYTAEVIEGSSGEDRVTYANIVSDLALTDKQAIAEPSAIVSKGQTIGDRGAVFSPTAGNRVAFWAWGKDHRANLWLYDQSSGQLEQLTHGGSDVYPQWSSDGKSLVLESRRAGSADLWLVTVD